MERRVQVIITGIVQGVGFRPFLFHLLDNLGLKGTIRNSGNLGVICTLSHPDPQFNFRQLPHLIKTQAPTIAFIEKVRLIEKEHDFLFENADLLDSTSFPTLSIVPSDNQVGPSLTLPADIAICDTCLSEFRDPAFRRYYRYPFLACAQCGPRFTIMKSLPYDRPNSTMDAFPFCKGEDSCEHDYDTPENRRFHAQTISCKQCGPHYYNPFPQTENDPIPSSSLDQTLASLVETIRAGDIVALKGIGGANLICRADSFETIQKLRMRKKKREFKPFAIMVPSIKVAKQYCLLSSQTEILLSSFRRPIVLCEKQNPFLLPENIAPGLAHLGIILPYMGIHYLLFDLLGDIPLIFTSGNISNLPIAKDNDEILARLEGVADSFFLHTREIAQRCDDSVIRPVLDYSIPIRRSRGYVPEYLPLPFTPSVESILAVGPELNSTGAISRKERVFPTQHIGNASTLEAYDFLGSALHNMKTLLKIPDSDVGVICADLHPTFHSTKLATKLADDWNVPLFYSIQHHHAHLAALMVDNQLGLSDRIVAITLDGIGYGEDHQSWGGEIILGSYGQYSRVGSLEPIPMIGGDLCAKYPMRMLLCILLHSIQDDKNNAQLLSQDLFSKFLEWRVPESSLPQGQIELNFLIKQFNSESSTQKKLMTSSMGRWLDAVSAIVRLCDVRSYRGEPAMRLEGFLFSSHFLREFSTYFHNLKKRPYWIDKSNGIVNIFNDTEIVEGQKKWQIRSGFLVAWYINHIISFKPSSDTLKEILRDLLINCIYLITSIAIKSAQDHHILKIGLSGGVAYNEFISFLIKYFVEGAGLDFLHHSNIPAGDGGISIGQIAIGAARSLNSSF